jgi:hypothetical protein
LRASKDGCKHSAEQHPSRRAEDGAHLRMTVRLLQDDGGGGSFHQSKPPNRCTSAFSRHTAPEFFKIHSPQKKRAQGRPGARCTRGLMCQDAQSKNAHEHTGSAETLRPSLRNGFTAYLRALPGETWLACHRRSRDAKHHHELNTSHRGVRTTRLCRPHQPRSSVATFASTAPRPNVSDDGQRPLSRDGMASNTQLIWVKSQG